MILRMEKEPMHRVLSQRPQEDACTEQYQSVLPSQCALHDPVDHNWSPTQEHSVPGALRKQLQYCNIKEDHVSLGIDEMLGL
jgi:hypothetical protein